MSRSGDPFALLSAARRSSSEGDWHAAEAAARHALVLAPDEPAVQAILALVLSENPESLDEAAHLAAAAVAGAPDEPQFRHLLITLLLTARRFDQALAEARRLRARFPDDRRALTEIALAANALEDCELVAALLDYERAIAVVRPRDMVDPFHHDIASRVRDAFATDGGSRAATMSGGVRFADVFAILGAAADGLRSFLEAAIATSGLASPRPLGISQAWANLMRGGDYEHSHIHDQAELSGVYYPAAIARGDSEEGALLFGPHHLGEAVPPLPRHCVKPRTGDVVLFPSHFPHQSVPFCGEGERISIAFDLR